MVKKSGRSRGRKLLHVLEDADEISILDSTLTQFIAEFQVSSWYSATFLRSGLTRFQLEVTILSGKDVREILLWIRVSSLAYGSSCSTKRCCIQAQEKQRSGSDVAQLYVPTCSTSLDMRLKLSKNLFLHTLETSNLLWQRRCRRSLRIRCSRSELEACRTHRNWWGGQIYCFEGSAQRGAHCYSIQRSPFYHVR